MLKQTRFPEYYEFQSGKTGSPEENEKKINAIVKVLTASEKFSLLGGQPDPPDSGKIANAGYLAGIPRLGVPEIRMYDGPAGVTSVRGNNRTSHGTPHVFRVG